MQQYQEWGCGIDVRGVLENLREGHDLDTRTTSRLSSTESVDVKGVLKDMRGVVLVRTAPRMVVTARAVPGGVVSALKGVMTFATIGSIVVL